MQVAATATLITIVISSKKKYILKPQNLKKTTKYAC